MWGAGMRYVLWFAILIGIMAIVLQRGALLTDYKLAKHEVGHHKVSVPLTNADLEGRLAKAINAIPRNTTGAGTANNQLVRDRARDIARELQSYPVDYNKPANLQLGESTPVELAIKTNEKQDTAPLFKGLEGEVTEATVLVANDVSAQLSGPPDRLKITLRGDKMRTISSPVPITWIWDVEPLKPGKAEVTLEVTSYIKTGKDKEPVPIRVLQDTWMVEAHGLEWAKYEIEQIAAIQAFIAAVGTMVVGALAWFGFRGWGKGKPDFET